MTGFLLATLLCACVFNNAEERVGQAEARPPAELVVYARDAQLVRGQTTDVIVEITNRSADALSVPGYVGLDRVAEVKPGPKAAPNYIDRMPGEHKGIAVGVRCLVPPGARDKFIAPRRHRNLRVRTHEIRPGESLLLKVELPADAFELGECRLVAYMVDGDNEVAKSKPATIRCTEAPHDAKPQ